MDGTLYELQSQWRKQGTLSRTNKHNSNVNGDPKSNLLINTPSRSLHG